MTVAAWCYLRWVEGVRDYARHHPQYDFNELAYMTDAVIIEVMKAAGARTAHEAGTAVWEYLHPEESEDSAPAIVTLGAA